jgi:2,4-didehydro-3-deoxy-L-rhamnonate hydrolase
MKICRFGSGRVGILRGVLVHDVTDVATSIGPYRYPLPNYDVFVDRLTELRPALESAADDAEGVPLAQLDLLPPVANPGKLVAAPVNYIKHLQEAQEDAGIHFNQQIKQIQTVGLFLKATSSMVGPSAGVKLRFPDRRTDHELELAAVIGRKADRVTANDALACVAGYCVGLDITVRGPEERSMRKSIDTYSVVGPVMVTGDELGDPSGLNMSLTVNGTLRQQANTRDLVLSLPELIEYASRYYTLAPGDITFTGTPDGVGPIAPGDNIRASIDRIGTIDVAVGGL